MKPGLRNYARSVILLAGVIGFGAPAGAQPANPFDARDVAKEAYIWGFPIVTSYRVQYTYFVDKNHPEYKAPWNTLVNTARVYTPNDKAIVSPNSDTPYSFVGADLRSEPLVVSVPEVEPGRYYSAQFIDMYTHNFAYVGSRATGNGAGSFLLAGPDWNGEKPAGVKDVIHCETQFAFIIFRTQLFNPDDIENVSRVQAGYKAQPLSQFLGQPAPAAAPAIDFPKPLDEKEERTSPAVLNELNFALQFMPTHPSEEHMMERFGSLDVGAGQIFDMIAFAPQAEQAIKGGIADAWEAYKAFKTDFGAGKYEGVDLTGTREMLKGNYLGRMMVAVDGLYGNSRLEAVYPSYFTDSSGQPIDGSHRYTLRFAPDQLPPVNAFWSLTLYKLPESLLYDNPLNRYVINSSMLPDLKRDAEGGITLYVQHAPPGVDKESNWLPSPEGAFWAALRLYWPKPEALDGTWKAPPLLRAD